MKIIFSDMDGTIIELNEARHEKDCEMLKELRKRGHLVAFNTGRNYQEAHFCIERHHFPYDYLILNNGAHIVDSHGTELFKKVIPQSVGRKIIEHSIQIPNVCTFFFNGNRTIGYCNGKTLEHTHHGHIELNDIDFIEEYQKAEEFDIIAVNQLDEGIEDILKVQDYIKKNFNDMAIGTLNTHYLDITAQGCSKGNGILTLESLLNQKVETYCIGDSYNDISMFETADYAYTFHHVDDSIKKHAQQQVHYVYEVIEDMLGGENNELAR